MRESGDGETKTSKWNFILIVAEKDLIYKLDICYFPLNYFKVMIWGDINQFITCLKNIQYLRSHSSYKRSCKRKFL